MGTLDKRETATENKFARDEEQAFVRQARMRKLLGLWAAEQMHMDSERANNYALSLVTETFDTPSLIEKVYNDLQHAGIQLSKERILEEKERIQQSIA